MKAEDWRKIKEIFNQAIELSPVERERFLSSFQNGDADLRREVEKLLAADENSGAQFEDFSFVAVRSLKEKIGRYKILREIGVGGMGTVYLAEREDLAQKVALKIIRHGANSDVVLRRFRKEQEILAALEHANIAHLLDVGLSDEGLPFLAMEYVEGSDLLAYCAENNLSLSDKLKLFRKICDAVAYAHSRLVVHRDLKPSNILVNSKGEPKLLDFGISKLLSENNTEEKGTVTSIGMLTPNYASPEQFRAESVSTAADVYSLGVILYELLTGKLPYDVENRRYEEVARIVCETNPQKPSDILTQSRKAAETGGKQNTTDKGNFFKGQRTKDKGRSLKGDIDNILLKALRKEPERRYSSIEKFSDDLRRYLEGLPVTARPDTFFYRAEKFVRRNRISVALSSLIILLFFAGAGGVTWQYFRAERERQVAEKRFNQVRELANNIVFKYYDEAEKLPSSTTLREMFVKDSLDYLDSLARDESSDKELRAELGKTFLRIARVQGRPSSPNLGDTASALENYRKGIEILEPLALQTTNAHLQGDLISAYTDYAVVLGQNGDAARASSVFRKMISVGENFRLQNPENDDLAARLAAGYMFWGDTLPVGLGENDNIAAYRKTIAVCENLLSQKPDDLRLDAYVNAAAEKYALALLELAKSARLDEDFPAEKRYLQEAEKLFAQNVELGEKLTRLYPNQILSQAILASAQIGRATVLIEAKDYATALHEARRAESFYRASLAADTVSVGQKIEVSVVEQKLGIIYWRTGDIDEAEKLFAHAFERLDYLVAKDPENFTYIKIRGNSRFAYADELLRRGEVEKARRIYKKAFDEMLAAAQTKDAAFAASLQGLYGEKLGDCALAEAEKNKTGVEKAIVEYEKAVEIWRKNGFLNVEGSRQDEKIFVLERKIKRLKNQTSG